MVLAPQAEPAGAVPPVGLEDAYRWCRGFARAHEQNFPMTSGLLPHVIRPHFAAL